MPFLWRPIEKVDTASGFNTFTRDYNYSLIKIRANEIRQII